MKINIYNNDKEEEYKVGDFFIDYSVDEDNIYILTNISDNFKPSYVCISLIDGFKWDFPKNTILEATKLLEKVEVEELNIFLKD